MDLSTSHPASQDDQRWARLCDRHTAAQHGKSGEGPEDFFYGVVTTGVVCRPACASRLPRRENVRFFDTLDQARRAGFRPCLRCRPDGVPPHAALAAKVDRARRHLDRAEGPVLLAELATVAGLSPFHLQRSFRDLLGVSPAAYARGLRAQRFADALSRAPVIEAIYAAGFESASPAYSPDGGGLGMRPGDVRRGGEHCAIRYSIVPSPLGQMLVAATERGVCSVAFGDSDGELCLELRERFPLAELVRDHDALAAAVTAVTASLQEPEAASRMPLHVRATAFQQRVWQALRAIPRGETRTYAQVAESIGQPTATRAVARACATNPLAVLVPCHRVIGADGSLTGYRWGVERKRRLLEMEGSGNA